MSQTSPSKPAQVSSPSRYSHLETLFGPRTRDRIRKCSVLVIGAGGIGCELLKNLVCTGFGHITIVDLDTVDTSNLNRQFLFQKKHVKRPKAIVARETASAFNPNVTIQALHANIMDSQFDQAYYKAFDLVLNALDNLSARRHVNKMCVMTKVPLIESGTAGYSGQVQPIRSGQMECYDCQPKPLPKTFPVCTIRSTPSSPIHCIVWAKNYLFPQLFGPEDENEGADLDEAIQNGESVKEVEALKEEVKRMKEIRAQLDSPEMSKIVFEKLFQEDIKRLLMIEDMWKQRQAPTPLNYDDLASQKTHAENGQQEHQASTAGGLKDQQTLSLKDSFDLFCSSLLALGKRIQSDPAHEPLRWDKDDDDALDFVTAASNLRANIFGIPQKTRFDVKEMAGNIIPAIATTNSAVSALIVFQAINILSRPKDTDNPSQNGAEADKEDNCGPLPRIAACRPWYGKTADRIIVAGSIDPPNPHCQVCQVLYPTVNVHPDCSLKKFIVEVLQGRLFEEGDDESITIQEGDRLLYDPDFTDNDIKTFRELDLIDGPAERVLRITDEAEKYVPLMFIISKNAPPLDKVVSVQGLPDNIPHRPAPEPKVDPIPDLKEDSDIEQVTAPNGSNGTKRSRTTSNKADGSKDDDEIVLVDQLDDSAKPPPAKKLKLDQPKQSSSIEIIEIS
ncbi:E1 ubiquitin-activating protein uba2 [Puccinia graminis f. sp. tritici]|uniref:Ubiquitin-activating enzyme E1-like n=1 Tax=Puccinia graminis f. sp. tritici TaxID=56615 RepID=A0A5B0LSV4_PUCGR|nr:E1 ubiquitin-activating protein uba2 [Puccinia graminis f. sp. tritici]